MRSTDSIIYEDHILFFSVPTASSIFHGTYRAFTPLVVCRQESPSDPWVFFDSCLDELKAKSKRVVMSLSNILLLRASISIQHRLSLRYFESLSLVTLYHENLYPRAPVDDKIHTFDDNINENE